MLMARQFAPTIMIKGLPNKISAGMGLSLIDRAVKESFAARCSEADLERIREYFRDGGSIRCIYCACATPDRWDHLHPVSRGGDTVPGNLVPACGRCDDSKQDKGVKEWANGTSPHRPPLEALPRILSAIKAYQEHFAHEPVEFEAKLSEEQRASYARFRVEIDGLRAHLQSAGLLKK